MKYFLVILLSIFSLPLLAQYTGTIKGKIAEEVDPIWVSDSATYASKFYVNSQGFLTTETDPVWISDSSTYASKFFVTSQGYLTSYTETDPVWISDSSTYASKFYVNSQGFLTSYTETDPVWISDSATYASKFYVNSQGFLTSYTETDPVWVSDSAIYASKFYVNNQGFLTSYTETDPIWVSDSATYASKFYVNNQGFLTSEVDGSITNELQTLSKSNDTIFLSDGGFAKDSVLTEATVDAYANNNGYLTSEVDGSVTNELQTLSWGAGTAGNDEITLSDGGGTVTITDDVNDADADPANEIQTISRTGGSLTVNLSDGGGSFQDSVLTETDVDAMVSNNGYLTSEVDGSITNELQTLSWSAGTGGNDQITLSDGGGTVTITDNVNDADADPANEGSLTATDGVGIVTVASNTSGSTDLTFTESGIVTVNSTGNNITIAATETDPVWVSDSSTYASKSYSDAGDYWTAVTNGIQYQTSQGSVVGIDTFGSISVGNAGAGNVDLLVDGFPEIELGISDASGDNSIAFIESGSVKGEIMWEDGENGISMFVDPLHAGGYTTLNTTVQPQLHINSTGVGIWTDDPSADLHVAATPGTFAITVDSNTYYSSSGRGLMWIVNNDVQIGDLNSLLTDVHLYNGGNRLTVKSDGSVGIGTETPDRTLEVTGNAIFSSGQGASNANVAIGLDRSADGNAILDLVAEGGETAYDFRLLRYAGANGNAEVWQSGTGHLKMLNVDGAGDFIVQQGADTALLIDNKATMLNGSNNIGTFGSLVIGDRPAGDSIAVLLFNPTGATSIGDSAISIAYDYNEHKLRFADWDNSAQTFLAMRRSPGASAGEIGTELNSLRLLGGSAYNGSTTPAIQLWSTSAPSFGGNMYFDYPGDVYFRQNGSIIDLFIEDGTGYVGVGTNDPDHKLHSYVASGSNHLIVESNSRFATLFANSATNPAFYWTDGTAMRFGTGTNNLTLNDEIMRLDLDGSDKSIITQYNSIDGGSVQRLLSDVQYRIQWDAQGAYALIDINPDPNDAGKGADVRFFRETLADEPQIIIYQGLNNTTGSYLGTRAGSGAAWMYAGEPGSGDAIVTPYKIHLLKDVTQNIGGATGTITYISWDDDNADARVHAGYTFEDVTNPSRIYADETGRYEVRYVVNATNSGANRVGLRANLRINGTTEYTRGTVYNYSRGTGFNDEFGVQYSTEIDLTAGDYIEARIEVQHADGTYTVNTINNECEIIINRIE